MSTTAEAWLNFAATCLHPAEREATMGDGRGHLPMRVTHNTDCAVLAIDATVGGAFVQALSRDPAISGLDAAARTERFCERILWPLVHQAVQPFLAEPSRLRTFMLAFERPPYTHLTQSIGQRAAVISATVPSLACLRASHTAPPAPAFPMSVERVVALLDACIDEDDTQQAAAAASGSDTPAALPRLCDEDWAWLDEDARSPDAAAQHVWLFAPFHWRYVAFITRAFFRYVSNELFRVAPRLEECVILQGHYLLAAGVSQTLGRTLANVSRTPIQLRLRLCRYITHATEIDERTRARLTIHQRSQRSTFVKRTIGKNELALPRMTSMRGHDLVTLILWYHAACVTAVSPTYTTYYLCANGAPHLTSAVYWQALALANYLRYSTEGILPPPPPSVTPVAMARALFDGSLAAFHLETGNGRWRTVDVWNVGPRLVAALNRHCRPAATSGARTALPDGWTYFDALVCSVLTLDRVYGFVPPSLSTDAMDIDEAPTVDHVDTASSVVARPGASLTNYCRYLPIALQAPRGAWRFFVHAYCAPDAAATRIDFDRSTHALSLSIRHGDDDDDDDGDGDAEVRSILATGPDDHRVRPLTAKIHARLEKQFDEQKITPRVFATLLALVYVALRRQFARTTMTTTMARHEPDWSYLFTVVYRNRVHVDESVHNYATRLLRAMAIVGAWRNRSVLTLAATSATKMVQEEAHREHVLHGGGNGGSHNNANNHARPLLGGAYELARRHGMEADAFPLYYYREDDPLADDCLLSYDTGIAPWTLTPDGVHCILCRIQYNVD